MLFLDFRLLKLDLVLFLESFVLDIETIKLSLRLRCEQRITQRRSLLIVIHSLRRTGTPQKTRELGIGFLKLHRIAAFPRSLDRLEKPLLSLPVTILRKGDVTERIETNRQRPLIAGIREGSLRFFEPLFRFSQVSLCIIDCRQLAFPHRDAGLVAGRAFQLVSLLTELQRIVI